MFTIFPTANSFLSTAFQVFNFAFEAASPQVSSTVQNRPHIEYPLRLVVVPLGESKP